MNSVANVFLSALEYAKMVGLVVGIIASVVVVGLGVIVFVGYRRLRRGP